MIDKILWFFDPNKAITLPELPCMVFREYNRLLPHIIMVPTGLYLIEQFELAPIIKWVLWFVLAIIVIIDYKFSGEHIRETYLTTTSVSVKLQNGQKRTFPLEKYAFYVSIWNVQGSMKSYVYRISLLEHNEADGSVIINRKIPLRTLLRPADLSLYIDHIQNQLPRTLGVIFENQKVRDEYFLKDFIR